MIGRFFLKFIIFFLLFLFPFYQKQEFFLWFGPILVKKKSKIQITQLLISFDGSNQIKRSLLILNQNKQGYKIKKKLKKFYPFELGHFSTIVLFFHSL
jgi:hypothetical protein